MKITAAKDNGSTAGRPAELPQGERWRVFIRTAVMSVFAAVMGAIVVLAALPSGIKDPINRLVADQALYVYPSGKPLLSEFVRVPGRLMRSPDLPQLVLDIKFKNLMQLYGERDDALAKGLLIQKDDSFVPGKARIGDETVRIKVRLKGDWLDHLHGKKWSFRVHVKDDEEIFGLRRFSIQHPKTRGYQGEVLYLETLRKYGVLAPRYFFAKVYINGNDLGIMAIEEHFSKELLERNHRKEGVIVKFDESQLFESRLVADPRLELVFNDHEGAPIDAFQSSKVARSPYLSEQYAVAVGLLRAFAERRKAASQVFDVEKMAIYLAVSQAFGAQHAVIFHNMRFYLNPFTSRLEPIGFDASLDRRGDAASDIILTRGITERILADPRMWAAFQAGLDRIESEFRSPDFLDYMTEIQDETLRILRSEFSLLQPFDLSGLDALIDIARTKPVPRLPNLVASPDRYPALVNAYFTPREHNGAVLEVVNIVPERVALREIRWVPAREDQSPAAISLDLAYPILVPPTPVGDAPATTVIELPQTQDWSTGFFEVTAALDNQSRSYTVRAVRSSPASESALPFRDATIDRQLSLHPFLTADRENSVVRVRPGDWRVGESLVVPPGYRLEVPPGTVLRFAEQAALIAYGEVAFTGAPGNPIRMTADSTPLQSSPSWPGVVVFGAPQQSRWSHVTVEQTRGVPWVGWTLTGGVTFYESDVAIDHSAFTDSRGEDALNIIASAFELVEVGFRNTASDAFDSDFSTGRVTGGSYSNIGLNGSGGDAIDVSGTEIVIEGTSFAGVSDKALSVGEQSQARILGINISRATTGVVSKDGSVVHLENSQIDGSRLAGLMAYTKKAEYGPARLVARGVEVRHSQSPALAQNGSTIEFNGKPVRGTDIDVDALYANAQKP